MKQGKYKNEYRVCKLLSIKGYLPYSDILGGGVCLVFWILTMLGRGYLLFPINLILGLFCVII